MRILIVGYNELQTDALYATRKVKVERERGWGWVGWGGKAQSYAGPKLFSYNEFRGGGRKEKAELDIKGSIR